LAALQDPANRSMRFPTREITTKLQVGAVRTADGRAGFRVPVVNLDLGGSGGLAAGGAADHHGRVRPAGRPLGRAGVGRIHHRAGEGLTWVDVPLASRLVDVTPPNAVEGKRA